MTDIQCLDYSKYINYLWVYIYNSKGGDEKYSLVFSDTIIDENHEGSTAGYRQ